MTISELINQVMMAAIHYRNRQIVFHIVMSNNNREKYHQSARDLETQKKRLLTAISKGAYIN